MKLIRDKRVLLSALGLIAGLALFAMPAMLGGVESTTAGYAYLIAGLGLAGVSLALLERYISRLKRPDLVRRQEIEARDERNTIIRDKAAARTLGYLVFVMLTSAGVSVWLDVEFDFEQWLLWIAVPIILVLYYAHIYYYKKRL